MLFTLIAAIVLPSLYIGVRYARTVRHRHENPKDYGYAVIWRFGQNLKISPLERLKKRIPWVHPSQLEGWLTDYKNIDRLVDELSRQGGPKRLGRKEVEEKFKSEFAFLGYEGLSQAVFLTSYFAMKDGYDQEGKQ